MLSIQHRKSRSSSFALEDRVYQLHWVVGASTLSTDNYQVTRLRPALSPWPARFFSSLDARLLRGITFRNSAISLISSLAR